MSTRKRPTTARSRQEDDIEAARERLRGAAREAIGVTGRPDAPALREGVRRSGVGWYPLIALGALVIVDEFQGYAFLVLGPEISATLGISRSVLGGIQALKLLAITLAALPMAAYVQRIPRRGVVAIVSAFAWSTMTLFTGFVANAWGMVTNLLGDGASTGAVRAVHQPLLVDSYPPSCGCAYCRPTAAPTPSGTSSRLSRSRS